MKVFITGVAGFIGSNLLEEFLKLGHEVVGIDNFETGKQQNLDDVKLRLSEELWEKFKFLDCDIVDSSRYFELLAGVDAILHQAALGSVPRSFNDPKKSCEVNILGSLAILDSARRAGVKRFVYASSSAVYGDSEILPKKERLTGRPLSPYAVTKQSNELYCEVYAETYGMVCVGLRYFNVFGPRQDPDGAYAAVIPRWINNLIGGRDVEVFGDGKTSRDFCYVNNVVQANLLAASRPMNQGHHAFNVACGNQTTLLELLESISEALRACNIAPSSKVTHSSFRQGDVLHSRADIGEIVASLGYKPTHDLGQGLMKTIPWYVSLAKPVQD